MFFQGRKDGIYSPACQDQTTKGMVERILVHLWEVVAAYVHVS